MKNLLCNNNTHRVSEPGSPITGFNAVLKFFLMVIFIVFTSATLPAQVIAELKSYLGQAKASDNSEVIAQGLKLQSLIYDLQPSVTIQDNVLSTYSRAPFVCVDTDLSSVTKLTESNPLFNQAELLTIRINNQNELNAVPDISKLQGFTNLKYVYFLCTFECTAAQINKVIKVTDTKILFFYLISIPA
jgi:hypothetical protein